MRLLHKILFFTFLLFGIILKAQEAPPLPPPGEGRGVGPGSPASPIDMYVYILALVAIVFIVYFSRKVEKKIA